MSQQILSNTNQSATEKAKDMTEVELAACITEVTTLKNRLLTPTVLSVTVKEVLRLLAENYSLLDRCELLKILRNGIYGQYGEFFEISAVTIRSWIDAYLTSHERELYLQSQAKAKQLKAISSTSTLTEKSKRETIVNNIITTFQEYEKDTSSLRDFGNVKYNYLDEHHLIAATPQEKWAAMQKAKTDVEAEKQRQRMKAASISDWIKKIRYSQNGDLISRAKTIVLTDFFSKIISNNKQENFIKALKNTI